MCLAALFQDTHSAVRRPDSVRLLSVGICTEVKDSCNRAPVSIKYDPSGPSFVENDCTMSSLLMPISFCSQTEENIKWVRREHTSLGPLPMAHHLLLFKDSRYPISLCLRSKVGKREQMSSYHCTDKESEAQGGWGTCPARGSPQGSGTRPWALCSQISVRQTPS